MCFKRKSGLTTRSQDTYCVHSGNKMDCHLAEVHFTGGILRHFLALSTPEQNPALKVLSTPAHPQVTLAVGLPLAKCRKQEWKTLKAVPAIMIKTKKD